MIQLARAQNQAAARFHDTQLGGFSPVALFLLAILSCVRPKPRVSPMSNHMREPSPEFLKGGRDNQRLQALVVRPLERLSNL